MIEKNLAKKIFEQFYGTEILKQEFVEILCDECTFFVEPKFSETNGLMIDFELDWAGSCDTVKTLDLNKVFLDDIEWKLDDAAWGDEVAAKNKKEVIAFADKLIEAAEKLKEMANK